MCLRIVSAHLQTEFPPKAAKADKHYVVYKALRHRSHYERHAYITPYRAAEVVLGKLLSATMRVYPQILYTGAVRTVVMNVDRGLHSFRGFYAAAKLAQRTYDGRYFPAIIPKGSELYYGTKGDVVSNQLIIFPDRKALNKWVQEN